MARIKSKAQRRKFAELLVEGKIDRRARGPGGESARIAARASARLMVADR